MGTPDSLCRAASYVESVQFIQGFQIANIEEIAFRKNWITPEQLERTPSVSGKTGYTQYLRGILEDPGHRNPNIFSE